MKAKAKDKEILMAFRAPASEILQLRRLAKKQDRTISAMIRVAIRAILQLEKGKTNGNTTAQQQGPLPSTSESVTEVRNGREGQF